MNKRSHIFYSLFILLGMALTAISCSSVPKEQYYTLVADKAQPTLELIQSFNDDSIGIGPIVIPNSLENFSVVSIENNNQTIISLFHLWAGNLKTNINQVLADNISTALNMDSVWAFPWDNRNRPKFQVRVAFENFMGTRGDSVTLQAKWTLLDDYGRKEIKTGKTIITQTLASESYLDYVQALNLALNQFSLTIATELAQL